MDQGPKRRYVTAETCQDRHAASKWLFGVLAGMMTIFLSGVIYAVNGANEAAGKAHNVSTVLQSHVARQEETERYLLQRIDEIRADIRENRALLHQILRGSESAN